MQESAVPAPLLPSRPAGTALPSRRRAAAPRGNPAPTPRSLGAEVPKVKTTQRDVCLPLECPCLGRLGKKSIDFPAQGPATKPETGQRGARQVGVSGEAGRPWWSVADSGALRICLLQCVISRLSLSKARSLIHQRHRREDGAAAPKPLPPFGLLAESGFKQRLSADPQSEVVVLTEPTASLGAGIAVGYVAAMSESRPLRV